MWFTNSYGEQSCTAGRSSFMTGQSVYRTGMSKVGVPGACSSAPTATASGTHRAARRPQMVDTGMSHIGFRCVRRVPEPTGRSLDVTAVSR
jgi:formylglycine-generating enzyme required for sulfatase activity